MNFLSRHHEKLLVTAKILACISAVLISVLIITMTAGQLIPNKYTLPLSLFLVLVSIGTFVLCFRKQPRLRRTISSIILSVALIVVSAIGIKLSSDLLKLIHTITASDTSAKQTIEVTKPFNVYISGIDTYGEIANVARSDVNIVATINPTTKQILLTTIPRDTYVPIAGGGNNQYDKLTHSGIYGITASTETVANLLETDISSYVRINFSSLIKIVDEIGGVDVENPTSFSAGGGKSFPQGVVHLNGQDALTFSRERYGLEGGDNERGLNQTRVIAAIIAKLSSPALLTHYQDVLTVFGDTIQTNISQKSLTRIINRQLSDAGSWSVRTSAISGTGQTGGLTSYAMPNSQLYMLVPNEASLQQAKAKIQQTLN